VLFTDIKDLTSLMPSGMSKQAVHYNFLFFFVTNISNGDGFGLTFQIN
jgi:hypothetical protein